MFEKLSLLSTIVLSSVAFLYTIESVLKSGGLFPTARTKHRTIIDIILLVFLTTTTLFFLISDIVRRSVVDFDETLSRVLFLGFIITRELVLQVRLGRERKILEDNADAAIQTNEQPQELI